MAQISKQLPSHQSGEKEGERSAYTCASLSNPPPLLSYSQSPTPHSPSPTPHSPSPTPHSPSPTPHSPSPTPHSPSPTPYSLPPPHSPLTNPVLPLNHRMSKTRSGVQALTVKSSSSCELTSVSTKHLLLSYCFIVGRSKSCLQAKWGDTPREAFQILGTSMIQTSPRLPPPITTHFRSRSVHSYIHNHYSAPSPSITQHLPHPSLSTFPIHRSAPSPSITQHLPHPSLSTFPIHRSAPSPSITQHLPHPSLSTFPIHRSAPSPSIAQHLPHPSLSTFPIHHSAPSPSITQHLPIHRSVHNYTQLTAQSLQLLSLTDESSSLPSPDSVELSLMAGTERSAAPREDREGRKSKRIEEHAIS